MGPLPRTGALSAAGDEGSTILAPLFRGKTATVRNSIEARGISQFYRVQNDWLPVLENASLDAAGGEFVAIIGPSGCGKSTLFNVLAGLQEPSSGAVLVDGEDVTGKLGLAGYMPQKDLLLPWKTVLDNAILGLELRGVPRRRARAMALDWFPRFGLEGFDRHFPATLSGGMRQRAALLRTFLTGRDILLLDEPFGALDALTRADMQEWLLGVWDESRKTIVLVTHDVDEAIYLSDRVYVMTPRPGRIRQVIEVPLPRPRCFEEVVTSMQFSILKRTVLSLLRSRAMEARE